MTRDQSPSQGTDSLRVAALLLWYPLFTQPFIFREVEGVRAHTTLSVYSLYGPNLRHCSEEMHKSAPSVTTYGLAQLPRVLAKLFRELTQEPRRFFCLVKERLVRPWPSLEIFGENLWAFCMGFVLADELKRKKIDVIYAPWPRGTAQAAWMVERLTGIPFVVTVRGDNLSPADPDLEEKMRASAYIRANNAADQKRIERFGSGQASGKTELIYNSLTLPDLPEKNPRILDFDGKRPLALMALGRFDVTKGFDILLRACALLRDAQFRFTLTLAGGGGFAMGLGKLEGKLRELCHQLALDAYVSFPGLLSHNELPNILLNHDIFVAPCVVDPSGRLDGIPNTVIEAMSLGLPVVASELHALPEIVRHLDTGYTVPPGDPEALAQAILHLAGHPAEAARLGRQGRSLARELFSPKINCQKLTDLLRRASEKRALKDTVCAE